MKKTLLLIILALAAFALPAPALAQAPDLIPPYHWTYHSLSALSGKGLLSEKVVPGKSAYTPVQVVSLVVLALKHAENDISLMGEEELAGMRQLADAYRPYFKDAGYDFNTIRNDIEICAMRAGLSAAETGKDFSANPRALYKKAADAVNRFTFDLYRQTAAQKKGGNLFLSPYSVTSALAVAYAGARGKTESQMEQVLFLSADMHKNMGALINEINTVPQDSAQVKTANAVWPSKSVKLIPAYSQTVRDYYGTALTPLNYQSSPDNARKKINSWVAAQTKNKIKDIIAPGIITKNTLMVLTNAIYFKAAWNTPFKTQNTKALPFYTAPGSSVKTTMMNRTDNELNYARLSDAQLLELPYKNGRFSMLVLLPDKGADIAGTEATLTSAEFGRWLAAMEPRRVEVTIPKFRQESTYELAPELSKMGMSSAFDAKTADFSGITGQRDLFISNIIHKTFIDVAEEGTEAAAATAVIMMKTSMMPPQDTVEFKADRPFIYMIRDNESGAILFIGKYSRP